MATEAPVKQSSVGAKASVLATEEAKAAMRKRLRTGHLPGAPDAPAGYKYIPIEITGDASHDFKQVRTYQNMFDAEIEEVEGQRCAKISLEVSEFAEKEFQQMTRDRINKIGNKPDADDLALSDGVEHDASKTATRTGYKVEKFNAGDFKSYGEAMPDKSKRQVEGEMTEQFGALGEVFDQETIDDPYPEDV